MQLLNVFKKKHISITDRRFECWSIKKPIFGVSILAYAKINLYTDNSLLPT